MAFLSRVLNHHNDKGGDKSPASSHSSHRPHLSPVVSLNTIGNNGSNIDFHSLDQKQHPTFKMSLNLESPPIILYGQPNESTGSIISGLLSLDIKPAINENLNNVHNTHRNDLTLVSSNVSLNSISNTSDIPPSFDEFELESVTLSLVQTIRYTKPFLLPSSSIAGCKDCSIRKNVLARWDVLTTRASFSTGSHAYPFSHLLPGSLPASSKLGSPHSHSYIKYDLIAVATIPKNNNGTKESIVKLPLNISRSILRGPDRNSLRVFPPTEVTASAVLPNVVYPKSSFPIELRLDNIVSQNNDRRWRMRKLTWRIEEHIKIKAETCNKHESKLLALRNSQKKSNLTKELKNGTSSGPGGPSKSSGLHHSTVQSNMFLGPCPSSQINQDTNENNENENQNQNIQNNQNNQTNQNQNQIRNQDEDIETDDVPPPPANELQNFVEDFLAPVNSISSPISTASNNSNTTRSQHESIQSPSSNGTPASPPIGHQEEELYLDELRTINHGEFKSGWKSDFSGRGRIELVADISAINCSTGITSHVSKKTSDDIKNDDNIEGLRNGANISCDIDDPSSGIYVNHTLIVEVIVAEELINSTNKINHHRVGSNNNLTPVASTSSTNSNSHIDSSASSPSSNTNSNTSQAHIPVGTPTGAARVLRMQFKLIMTERSGLGIAWDDEVPPTYEDVRTLSPPTYQETTPLSTPNLFLTPPPVAAHRSTPGVLYGVGDTPIVGTFGNYNNNGENVPLSIDSMVDLDDRIQDFTL